MFLLGRLVDYNIILINFAIITIVAILLLAINFLIRQKSNTWERNTQKYSAYECGFEPFSESQSQVFEIQFFLVSIMFLIFDIELALMFPWAVHFCFLSQSGFWVMMFFIILLTVGFFYEWKKGALNWNITPTTHSTSLWTSLWFTGNSESLLNFSDFLDYAWTIEQFVCICILSLVIISVTKIKNLSATEISKQNQKLVLALLLILIFVFGRYFFGSTCNIVFIFHNYFVIDFYTQFAKFVISGCLFFLLVFWARDYIYYHKYIIWEFPVLLLLATWFMLLLVSSINLFSLFVSLEGLSLCLYILAAYDFDRRSSSEAALKYFTLGTLSSGFLLFGIVLIYIAVGSLDYLEIYQFMQMNLSNFLLRIGSCLIFFSFVFKLGAWPCHQWVPDVYQGSPTIVTAFFATAVKASILLTVLRLFNHIVIEKPILAIICIMSLATGIFGALKTDKIKRFLAYAAINQIGFILIGIFVYAINAVLIYFLFYLVTLLMIFLIILNTVSLSKQKTFELTFLSDFRSLSFYNKTIIPYLLIILFAMAGLPPFITALTKWYILLILAKNNYIFLLFVVIILTILSIYYYIRLVKSIFFEDINSKKKNKIIFYFKNTFLARSFLGLSAVLLVLGAFYFYTDFAHYTSFFLQLQVACDFTFNTLPFTDFMTDFEEVEFPDINITDVNILTCEDDGDIGAYGFCFRVPEPIVGFFGNEALVYYRYG